VPPGWIHKTECLLAFGNAYEQVHAWKDAPAKTLGVRHRFLRHDWYWRCGRDWSLANPFPPALIKEFEQTLKEQGPEQAEIRQADITHDWSDRHWQSLSRADKESYGCCLISLLEHPEEMRRFAGVDVISEKIHRIIGGVEVWEDASGIRRQWLRLLGLVRSRTLSELLG